MTKYKQMQHAAELAQKNHVEFRDRSTVALSKFYEGFRKYCEIPRDRATILRWNGVKGDSCNLLPADEGRTWVLPAAVVFDEGDDAWVIGFDISLSEPNNLLRDSVSFYVCALEKEGSTLLKVGFDGDLYIWDTNNLAVCEAFYEFICREILQLLPQTNKLSKRSLGFTYDPSHPTVSKS